MNEPQSDSPVRSTRFAPSLTVFALAVLPLLAVSGLARIESGRGQRYTEDSSFVGECLRAGTLPTWHPGRGLGEVLAATTDASPWYPPHWLWIAFEPKSTAPYLLTLHLALVALGSWLLLRGATHRVLLTLLVQGAYFGASWFFHASYVEPAVWAPWMLWGLASAQLRTPGAALRISVPVGLALFAGSLAVGFGVLASGLLCWLVMSLRSSRSNRFALRSSLALLAGLLLASARLLPRLEAVRLARAEVRLDEPWVERLLEFPPVRVVAHQVSCVNEAMVLGLLRAAPRASATAPILRIDRESTLLDRSPPRADQQLGTISTPLALQRPAPHRWDVQVEASDGGWLVFNEAWLPGWKCNVNGGDVDIERVDHLFRAVPLRPGDSLVRTWYEPWSLRIGTTLSLLTFLWLLWRRKRESRSPA